MKGVGLGALQAGRQVRGDLIHLGVGASVVHVQPDTGCKVAPRCLECPLERCRYDTPGGMTTVQRERFDDRVAALRAEGRTIRAIARAEGVAPRTVQRSLKRIGL